MCVCVFVEAAKCQIQAEERIVDFTVTDRTRGRQEWLYLNASYAIKVLLFWLQEALNIGIMVQFGNCNIKTSSGFYNPHSTVMK